MLAFFSETVFWSLPPPPEELASRAAATLAYALFGWLALALLSWCRARGPWSLLLAGAAFGWGVEGVFAMTAYGDASMPFPLTLSWTALAWHMPLSFALGLYALGRALRDAASARATLGLSLALGLFWGGWGHGWLSETPPLSADPAAFYLHALATTAALALAHAALAWGRPERFRPGRRAVLLAATPVALFFAAVTTPAIPFAPLVLAPLLGVTAFALRHARGPAADEATRAGGGADTLLARLAGPVRARNAAVLVLVLPAVATVAYAALGMLGEPVPTHVAFAVLSIPGGAALFLVALAKALGAGRRARRASAPATVPTTPLPAR